MSLRWRFVAALTLLAAIAVSGAAVIAYAMTASRLSSEVNTSLEQAAANFFHGRGAERLAPPPQAANPALGTTPPRSGPPPRPAPGSPPPGLLNLAVEQRLTAAGTLVASNNTVTLPVTSSMRTLARNGGAELFVTLIADGDPYRIVVVPLQSGGAVELGRDVSEDNSLLTSLKWRFALLDLVVSLAAGLLGAAFATRLSGPITRLTRAVDELRATGRLRAPIEVGGRDEVGRLARAFAELFGALVSSREQQQRLVEDAGHELRTPLTSLRANIDLLRRHRDLPEDLTTRVLDDLDAELSGLTVLVNEVVELATDRRDEELARDVDLARICERVAERARTRSTQNVIVVSEPITLSAQPAALERAVSNLVDNAAKFSPPDSSIELVVGDGFVEVRDEGPGIPGEDLTRIFDRFYRSPEARSLAGSGLGLAIVRDVAEHLGGRAYATNRYPKGACVGFTFARRDASSDDGACD